MIHDPLEHWPLAWKAFAAAFGFYAGFNFRAFVAWVSDWWNPRR